MQIAVYIYPIHNRLVIYWENLKVPAEKRKTRLHYSLMTPFDANLLSVEFLVSISCPLSSADWRLFCLCCRKYVGRVKVVQGHCRPWPPFTGDALVWPVSDRRPCRPCRCRRPSHGHRTARRATPTVSGDWSGSVGRRRRARPCAATSCRLQTEL